MPIKFLLLLSLSCLLAQPLTAAELTPFEAKYDLFRGNSKVAESKMSLRSESGFLIWRLQSKPSGFLSFFINKEPWLETYSLDDTQDKYPLLLELSGDDPDKPAQKSAWFDLHQQQFYFSENHQVEQKPYTRPVYSYLTVHQLYLQMKQNQLDQTEVDFHRDGKITESSVTLEKSIQLPGADRLKVDRLRLVFEGGKKSMIYYYTEDTLAPLKIEQIKKDQDSSVLWRKNWKNHPDKSQD